eukprot:2364333-Alexandrium_andersonii.AAC.1
MCVHEPLALSAQESLADCLVDSDAPVHREEQLPLVLDGLEDRLGGAAFDLDELAEGGASPNKSNALLPRPLVCPRLRPTFSHLRRLSGGPVGPGFETPSPPPPGGLRGV